VEYAAIILSALAAALGAITLWVLSGLRIDISDIRSQTQANREVIAELKGRCQYCRNHHHYENST
jgi:hypothetical protein